jgi:nickel-dependent lactate racemase
MKAMYRTRMAIEDGGEVIILAHGVKEFGEDPVVDKLIRKYGYSGTKKIEEMMRANSDLGEYPGVAAHLIHGSSDGRFTVRYAAPKLSREEVECVHLEYTDYEEAIQKYNPAELKDGFNELDDGEEIYFVRNPALGLWICEDCVEGLSC